MSVSLRNPSALLQACPGGHHCGTHTKQHTGLKEGATPFLTYWISQGTRAHRLEAPQDPAVLSQGFLGQGRTQPSSTQGCSGHVQLHINTIT